MKKSTLPKKPRKASLDEVKITRKGDDEKPDFDEEPFLDGDESEFPMDGDEDVESDAPPECEDGPCCQNGQWLPEHSNCLYGADDYACTSDLCNTDYECEHTRLDGFCLIGGVCALHHEDHSENSCLWCDSEENEWAAKPSTESCNDQEPCTYDDHCLNGECTGSPITCEDDPTPCGARRTCNGSSTCDVSYPDEATACADDGLTCTDDHCDSQGGCTHERRSGACWIGGVCYENGEASPNDPCQECDPKTNAWVAKPRDAACEDGNTCTYDDYCNAAGVCVSYPYVCMPRECQEASACDGEGGCIATNLQNDTPCGNDGLCTGPNFCGRRQNTTGMPVDE